MLIVRIFWDFSLKLIRRWSFFISVISEEELLIVRFFNLFEQSEKNLFLVLSIFRKSETVLLSLFFFSEIFFIELSLPEHIIRIENSIRRRILIWEHIFSVMEAFLLVNFKRVWIPFTQEVDNVFDDLGKDLLFTLKLAFEFLLKTLIFAS